MNIQDSFSLPPRRLQVNSARKRGLTKAQADQLNRIFGLGPYAESIAKPESYRLGFIDRLSSFLDNLRSKLRLHSR